MGYKAGVKYIIKAGGIDVHVEKKNIKNMYLRVSSPEGTVSVSAPQRMSNARIEAFVLSRMDWILKQQAQRKSMAPERVFSEEDRKAFRAMVEAALSRWEPVAGKRASSFSVRNMKSRWGSCNPSTARMSFNLRLMDMPPECLDYVVCHELCHLYEANHSPRFWAIMDRVYPNWKNVRAYMRRK